MPFPSVLARKEYKVSSSILTQFAESISYDDNFYTMRVTDEVLSITLLQILPGRPWPGVVELVSVPSMSQIDLFENF